MGVSSCPITVPKAHRECSPLYLQLESLQAMAKRSALFYFGLFFLPRLQPGLSTAELRLALPRLFLAELWLLSQEQEQPDEKVNTR